MAKSPIKERVFPPPSPTEPKVELEKREVKEMVGPPLPTDKKEGKDKDWEMIADNFLDLDGNFVVLCNVVLVLPIEYDVVTDVEEEYSAE